jgi:hypothetical protein
MAGIDETASLGKTLGKPKQQVKTNFPSGTVAGSLPWCA